MLAIARALLSKPKLLLLDEPSMGLAPLIVADIFRIIREIKDEGTTVLLSRAKCKTSSKSSRLWVCNGNGKIIIEGPAQQLLQDNRIVEAYLGKKSSS